MRLLLISAIFLLCSCRGCVITVIQEPYVQAAEYGEVIVADSNGIEATMKEVYGDYIIDTCTAVILKDGIYWTTHKDRPSGTYPTSRWSNINNQKLEVENGGQ